MIGRCNGQLEGWLKIEFENIVNFTEVGIESVPDFKGRITEFFN